MFRSNGELHERVRFLVEESGFFESSFLVKEGLINKDNFVGMFGLVGLADGANTLMVKDGKEGRYGNSAEADDLAERIMEAISDFAQNFEAVHSPLTNNRFLLHAQVGMDYDEGVTAGVRIPVGDEPKNLSDHLRHSARFTNFYQQDVVISLQWKVQHVKNPKAMLDTMSGAFDLGHKYMSFYEDGDLIRITGYLVKRSEMEKIQK